MEKEGDVLSIIFKLEYKIQDNQPFMFKGI